MERNRSLVLRQTPAWAQSLAGVVIGLSTVAVIGGIFFRIDEVVTAQGQLKSIGGTIEVATPAGGQIDEVFFKDGDLVQEGVVLVKFDTREAKQRKSTLLRLIELEKKQLDIQLSTISSQKNTLKSRQDVLQKRLATKTFITDEMYKLVVEGGFQRMQYLEQLDSRYELQKQVTELKEQRERLELQLFQITLEADKSIDRMNNELKSTELQLQYQIVRSPITGIVFDPKVGVDSVSRPGERILSIVPQNGLYAEVLIPNVDIGFVKKGQKAKVRIDAFPFTRYGELEGVVDKISADALPPDQEVNYYRFPVRLKLDNSFLESKGIKIPLQSGMSVTSNLKLRDKRVISLISDLLVDQTDSIRSIRQQ